MSFETCEIKNINVTWYVTGVMAYISNDFTRAFFCDDFIFSVATC